MATEDMTPGEVARRLEDVVREVRTATDRMLLREVYDAHHQALEKRVEVIEIARIDDAKAARTQRQLVYGLFGTFIVTLIVQVILILMAK